MRNIKFRNSVMPPKAHKKSNSYYDNENCVSVTKKRTEFKKWNFTGCKNEKWLKFIDERVTWK